MATNMPQIRHDLRATPAEDQGIKYFDVRDPRSGVEMRLYDFEWLIATRMDGARGFSELASWAQSELSLSPSAADLSEYAAKLEALGFFESDGELEVATSAPATAVELDSEPESELQLEIGEEPATGEPMNVAASAPTALQAAPQARSESAPGEGPTRWRGTGNTGSAPVVGSLRDQGTERVELPRPTKRSSGLGSVFGGGVVLVLAAAAVAYVKFIGPTTAARVTVKLAEPSEVVRLYEGMAPIKKGVSQDLSFGEDGRVSDVVAQGTEVKAGAPLASLEAFAKVEKDLADVKDRAAYYDRLLQAARTKNVEEEIKRAEAKVAEKQKLVADLEARAGKLRIVASSSGSVTQVMVSNGQEAKAGLPAIRLADPRVIADFDLPAGLTPQVGAPVSLQKASGGALLDGRVARLDGNKMVIEITGEPAAKPGEMVRLVKAKVPNVVILPPSALVKHDGADAVFVLSSGQARLRNVTVVDRSPAEVVVGTGLAAGDSVVIAGAETLTDGRKATAQ